MRQAWQKFYALMCLPPPQYTMCVDIYADYEEEPSLDRMRKIDKYLRDHYDETSVFYIFIVNQSSESLAAWESYFDQHPLRYMIRFIRDVLIADDGYISAMYKFNGIPTKPGQVEIYARLIMFSDDLPGRIEHFQKQYEIMKPHLNKHYLDYYTIFPDGCSNFLLPKKCFWCTKN